MKAILISSVVLLTVSAAAISQEMAGKTMVAKGQVLAQAEQGPDKRKLKRRAPIYGNDVVSTGDKSRAQIRMTDGGMLALKANSELVISDYQFSNAEGKGSVVMELVKGGLRSVTGTIKAESGDYKLKTPVGSIGIRGTHYEVELVGSELFVAVWDGAIDMSIDVGSGAGSSVSFGDGEDYSFASIDAEGNVTELIEPPENFNSGMSAAGSSVDGGEDDDAEGDADTTEESSEQSESTSGEQESDSQDSGDSEQDSEQSNENANNEDSDTSATEEADTQAGDDSQTTEETQVADTNTDSTGVSTQSTDTEIDASASQQEMTVDAGSDDLVGMEDSVGADLEQTSLVDASSQPVEQISDDLIEDESFLATDDFNTVETETVEELLANRSGRLTYDAVSSFEGSSSAGALSNFQMAMTIDFDTLGVTAGALTMDDAQGEWRATFSGYILSDGQFDMDISHASHGNNLADGEIDASFFDGLDSVIGNFNLAEVVNNQVTAKGSFLLK